MFFPLTFQDEVGRIEGDEINYNAVAKKIADAYRVAIDDLWLATRQFPYT